MYFIKKTMDEQRIREVVKEMYRGGENLRSTKKSNPNTLIELAKKNSKKCLFTLGLYAHADLPAKDWMTIHEKKCEEDRNDPQFLKRIGKFLLKHENDKNAYFHITLDGRRVLEKASKTGELTKGELKVFNVRNIFCTQERQKKTSK